MTDRKIMEG